MHDLGLSKPDIAHNPRAFKSEAAKRTGLLMLVWLASMIASVLAARAAGAAAGIGTLVALIIVGVWWVLTRRRRTEATFVLELENVNQSRRLTWLPFFYLLGALAVAALELYVFAVPMAIAAVIAAIVARRARRAPISVAHVRSALSETEIQEADAFAADSTRRWHADGTRVLAVTSERVLLASGFEGENAFIRSIGFEDIESFDVGWHMLGNFGSITLNFRRPIIESESTSSIKLSNAAPRNIARVARALRAHRVAGPDIDLPTTAQLDAQGTKSKLRQRSSRVIKIIALTVAICVVLLVILVTVLPLLGVDLRQLDNRLQQRFGDTYPADGRSNLTGGGASIEYPASSDLVELRLDEDWDDGPNDGARWELRSKASDGYNVVSLSNYVFIPLLDNPAAVERWVEGKQAEREELADGRNVTYTTTKVDGRTGYVWSHPGKHGYWYYAAWFPDPEGTIRLECIAKNQRSRFENLCSGALETLKFKRR